MALPPDSDSSAEHGHRIRQNLNRPLLDIERLSFFEPKVGYRWGLIWSLSPG